MPLTFLSNLHCSICDFEYLTLVIYRIAFRAAVMHFFVFHNFSVPVCHYNGNSDVPKVTNSLYLLDHLSEEDGDDFEGTWSDTTTPTSQHPVPRGWSDVTLTGSVMDRSSYTSWEENEGVSYYHIPCTCIIIDLKIIPLGVYPRVKHAH